MNEIVHQPKDLLGDTMNKPPSLGNADGISSSVGVEQRALLIKMVAFLVLISVIDIQIAQAARMKITAHSHKVLPVDIMNQPLGLWGAVLISSSA